MEWKGLQIKFTDRKLYKVNITRIYAGTSLWKFEITGGSKRAVLDKHLYRKTNTWMQPVGGFAEKDVLLLGRIIDYLVKIDGKPPQKKTQSKDSKDWTSKTVDLDTIKLLELMMKE